MSFLLYTALFLITSSFTQVDAHSTCKETLSSNRAPQTDESLKVKIDNEELSVTGSYIEWNRASDLANFRGPHLRIENVRIRIDDKSPGGLLEVFESTPGYRIEISDSVALDELCRKLTQGEFPYVETKFVTEKTSSLRKTGSVIFYSDRGGMVYHEYSSARLKRTVLKDLVCVK